MDPKRIAETFANDAKMASQGEKIMRAVIRVGYFVNISRPALAKELQQKLNCTIEIKDERPRIECTCGYEGLPVKDGDGSFMLKCPKCKSSHIRLIAGDCVVLEGIEV